MKLLVSMGITILGAAFSLVAPQNYTLPIFLVSAVGGSCVALHRSRRVILKLGFLSWTREELCRHLLITGDTGSGKTTGGFHNILVQLTKTEPDWGGLILGVKGDEHRFISELAEAHNRSHDVVHLQVRPENQSTKWKPPHRFNLLSDRSIPWMTHAKIIVDIASSMTEGTQHAFFRPIAQIALANAFSILDELGQTVTLTKAYDLLTSQKTAEKAIKPFLRNSATTRQRELADFMQATFTGAKAHEQREAIEGTIKTYLGFFLDPDVAAVFSSDEPDTLSLSQLDQGAMITVTMPQRLISERRYLQTYLKMLFYVHVLRRFDKDPSLRKNENLLLLVADEFQDLVTASEDGISDHKVIDRIRAAGAAIIAGMQSEISADPAIGLPKRKVLSLNMRSRLIFRAADLDGAVASADFIGKELIWKKSKSSKTLGPITHGRRQEEEHRVKPAKLMRLKDHQAVIAHPSKKYRISKLKPVDGKGRIYPWFNR